ncbi:hypothetical protein K458DRAFT_421931 [Lentithecium fluviatile CBS 122367]|uniref:Uncharacterized protein n=1 Tax=Lentithecium fluviatile CBS 122367 TaxID=1168545 RepID=A0A6G1INM0_9PLEO|nr:hypothetical protein K458DRAFT_421931 [Lentithecium fluviatile CBS 122367]
MVSTSSKTVQTHLEDYATPKDCPKAQGRRGTAPKKSKSKYVAANTTSKKRKLPSTMSEIPVSKRSKPSNTATKSKQPDPAQEDNPPTIIINRAPVLQLWSACVTHFLYPALPWSTCISAGSAISTICAVAKGRSIGTISERDDSEPTQWKREQAEKVKKDFDEIHVMQFRLKLKDGLALVGSEKKGKPANEELLRKKYGEDAYARVKKCFKQVLRLWEGEEDELSKRGFRMYERLRPDVSKGEKGWGRKGELSLETVKSVVSEK